LWKRLRQWQNNIDQNISKGKYLEMCDLMGDDPDPEKCPPDLEDFPLDVQNAILVYNKLGDRVAADIGYLGKEYSNVDLWMRIYKVENEEIFLESLLILDQKNIEKSMKAMEREREKLKKK
jgi:hypothetical protein